MLTNIESTYIDHLLNFTKLLLEITKYDEMDETNIHNSLEILNFRKNIIDIVKKILEEVKDYQDNEDDQRNFEKFDKEILSLVDNL